MSYTSIRTDITAAHCLSNAIDSVDFTTDNRHAANESHPEGLTSIALAIQQFCRNGTSLCLWIDCTDRQAAMGLLSPRLGSAQQHHLFLFFSAPVLPSLLPLFGWSHSLIMFPNSNDIPTHC